MARPAMTWRKQRDCVRCGRIHYSTDSAVCEDCWREMGQMSLEIEEEEADAPPPDMDFNEPLIESQWDETGGR